MAMDQYGLFTSINLSYFDVNYRGTNGFDTLPYAEEEMQAAVGAQRRPSAHLGCRVRWLMISWWRSFFT